jgi:hypothetical protein
VTEKLKEIYEATIENGLKYEGNHKSIDYFNLSCKATKEDNVFSILGNRVCMFNYSFDSIDSVMMLFSIPINSKEVGAKNIAERVMEVIAIVEECFITTDFVKSEELKEDKFVYITIVKKVEDGK